MRVLKFGGSSIATPERIRDVAAIILDAVKEEPVIVVVSAFQGISNQLLACGQMASSGDENYLAVFDQIARRHFVAIDQLIPQHNRDIKIAIEKLLLELNEILQGIFLLKELTPGMLDHIASFGERMSANIIATYMNQHYPAEFVDSQQLIFTDDTHTHANVLFDKSYEAIREFYDGCISRLPILPIVTGFIGSGLDGRITTLGRNSSDYSATIIGAALDASRVEIWTDVDGVYSADPHFVHTAFIVPHLSFDEAIELSYFGAKVLHPSTFIPVIDKQIPILIKNTLHPACAGTLISHQESSEAEKKWAAKSITAIDDITLLIWKGGGAIDVSRTIERLFKALMLANVHVFLVLEGSPKHTICLAISHNELEKARKAIQQEFYLELQHQLISLVEKPSQSIIAVIGDEMKNCSPDIAGKMFKSLGKGQIIVNAIVQGASERNLSLLIDSHQRTRALNYIHQSLFSEYKNLSLIIIGAGRVGSALIQHLNQQRSSLLENKIKVTICAITNSKKMLINPDGINLEHWQHDLENSQESFEISAILKLLPHIECSNVALVDCTASDAIVEKYPLFIQEGVHIITPNKRANVLPYKQWKNLKEQFARHQCYFLCRTNVGAGLPILTVLEDLLACGDTIYKIEGIISGTLSYLFNHYDGTEPFSKILQQAQVLGMTEPDPREDLSGIDVGRKLLILARQMGWEMNMSDISVQNLVPERLRQGKFTEQFYSELSQEDDILRQRLLKCRAENKILRYIGILHDHKASAQLEEIPMDHPLALSCYSDNIVAFTTYHYHDAPLVIRGPGAGVECTALGVFSDILKLVSYLPD